MLATRDPYFGVIPGNLLFLLALILAWALFMRRSRVLVQYLRLGRPDPRWDEVGERLGVVLRDVLGQGRMFRDLYAGFMHAFIFWGFLVVTVMTLTFWVGGVIPQVPTGVIDQNPVFLLALETFELAVLVAVGMAFLRRPALHPQRLTP